MSRWSLVACPSPPVSRVLCTVCQLTTNNKQLALRYLARVLRQKNLNISTMTTIPK